ncbi:hypothetical protein [Tellurirhabdus bombi]|uniref:hypothetical protein n=1 Tax=Tellurirhabdus bombi TaxID=2907205 RepID=UPI001F3244EA|nr:hypothetical protein [Tellurirhabdus bombi]
MCKEIQQVSRRRRCAETEITQRSNRSTNDAFLNYQFQPICVSDQKEFADQQSREESFFTSLSHLASLYKWPIDNIISKAPYPLNIAFSFDLAQWHLSQINPDLTLVIIQDDNHPATLATVQTTDLGSNTLYYIPIKPYWKLVRSKKHRSQIALIESVLAYLCHIVEIPYFTKKNGDGYLAYQYEMLRDFVDFGDEDEDDSFNKYITQLAEQVDYAATYCHKRFNHAFALLDFANRVKNFTSRKGSDSVLIRIATKFLALYEQYPRKSIMETDGLALNPDEIGFTCFHYSASLSFFWTDDDETYEQISQSLDADFSEGQFEQLKSVQLFDQPQESVTHSLDFEQKLLGLLEDFIQYLYELNENE